MPEPVLFVPCLTPIINAITNKLSVVDILDVLQPLPLDEEMIPEGKDARFIIPPFRIVTVWHRKEDDLDREFEHTVMIVAPDGRETSICPETRFRLPAPYHRIIDETSVILGSQAGERRLILKLRPAGTEEWVTCAEYSLVVEDLPKHTNEEKNVA